MELFSKKQDDLNKCGFDQPTKKLVNKKGK